MEEQIDETLNIGSEVRLAEGLTKNVKIGTIGTIRQVRKIMKDSPYQFSVSIGREPWLETELGKAVDWPKVEATYREAFNLILEGGLPDEEYDQVDFDGIEELEKLITRFL
ncbi:hypothetical protein [Paenibacillus sp. FSL L8-0463]|uniref:hypothetical protein n=1 Tax=Paenibacillus sp. FSL L8-0463 TaxID=2954687 RepID=UPI00311A3618